MTKQLIRSISKIRAASCVLSMMCLCTCITHALYMCLCARVSGACSNGSFPDHLIGEWYSIDQGLELQTEISAKKFSNKLITDGSCYDMNMIEGSMDAQGNYDAKILIYNQ